MNKVYLLIGGNVGNRLQNLGRAIELINTTCGNIIQQSAIYETAAWGNTRQQSFLNQALLLETSLSPLQLITATLEVEETMGRVRAERYGPRIIDIDMLFYNNDILHHPQLTIPHPEIQNRRFALVPMQEIAPDYIHPVLQKTIQQLLEECPDELAVTPIVPIP